MHRFFVSPESLIGSRVSLGSDVAQQIRRVLRMRPGDRFYLLDGLGYEYHVELADFEKDQAWAEVLSKAEVHTEPIHRVSIYMALLNKPDKFEWVLQKCTEIGAARFVPLIAERSVTGAVRGMRRERWERIIMEAAEQSGRGLIPGLDEPVTLQQALEEEASRSQSEEQQVAIMPELVGTGSIADALKGNAQSKNISIYIGPEGGFSPAEVEVANSRAVKVVCMGARTLRAETAAIAALTLTLHELGEMGYDA